MKVFGKKLREAVAQLGLSNADVAHRAQLSERRYGHYVQDNREPDLAILIRIAKVLNTTPNDLLGFGEGSEKPSRHSLLSDRLRAAAQVLSEGELETLVVLADGLAARHKKRKAK